MTSRHLQSLASHTQPDDNSVVKKAENLIHALTNATIDSNICSAQSEPLLRITTSLTSYVTTRIESITAATDVCSPQLVQ